MVLPVDPASDQHGGSHQELEDAAVGIVQRKMELAVQLIFTPSNWRMMEKRRRGMGMANLSTR